MLEVIEHQHQFLMLHYIPMWVDTNIDIQTTHKHTLSIAGGRWESISCSNKDLSGLTWLPQAISIHPDPNGTTRPKWIRRSVNTDNTKLSWVLQGGGGEGGGREGGGGGNIIIHIIYIYIHMYWITLYQ